MDVSAQTPNQNDDMVIKLQRQLEMLKKQRRQEEKQIKAQYQQKENVSLDDIGAEDILNAFSQGVQVNTKPQNDISAEDILNAFKPSSQTVPAVSQTQVSQQVSQKANIPNIPTDVNHISPNAQVNGMASLSNSQVPVATPSLATNPVLDPNYYNQTNSSVSMTENSRTDSLVDFSDELQNIKIPEPVQPVGSVRKESIQSVSSQEQVKFQEISTELEKDHELDKWVEEVPEAKAVTLPKPVQDDYGQILVEASQIPKPNITLPITEPEMEKALHHRVADSVRWLYEWAKRLILLQPGRVYYKNNNS